LLRAFKHGSENCSLEPMNLPTDCRWKTRQAYYNPTRLEAEEVWMKHFALVIALCCASGTAAGQHQHPSEAKPAPLLPGVGERHHPVSTRQAAAQKFFDQGLALIYAFNHEEAARSFQRAAELDPRLAMAYWGIALAVGPNYNEAQVDPERMKSAYEAIQKARSLASQATERERGYIEALAKRCSGSQATRPELQERDGRAASALSR
jgi:tetratricopeptide (TPR) repeat protein